MKQKKVRLMSLASALAAIAPSGQASVPPGTPALEAGPKAADDSALGQPNAFYNLRGDLMGLITSTAEDGTLLAQHYSHSSHASHASHASHYSGR